LPNTTACLGRSTLSVEHSPLASLTPAARIELEKRLLARQKPGLGDGIKRHNRSSFLPLSLAQQRLWFIEELEPNNATYNVVSAARICGPLNVTALQHALLDVARRHETLRSRLPTRHREPFVIIDDDVPPIFVREVPGETIAARDANALAILDEESNRPIALATGPLFRPIILRIDPNDHLLASIIHHAVCDEWSLRNLHREIDLAYRAHSEGADAELPALPVQYADFSVWQREKVAAGAYSEQRSYWKAALAGAPTEFTLTFDHVPQTPRAAAHHYRWMVDPEVALGCDRLGRLQGATPFMTSLAAFAVLLYVRTGAEDIVIGTPVAGRPRPELQRLIGFFANTIVLRLRVSAEVTFRELLAQVRSCVLEGIAHQDVPYEQVVEAINPARSLDRLPLFQLLFSHRDSVGLPLTDPALKVSGVRPRREYAKCDLWLSIVDEEDGRWASFTYDVRLYKESTIASVALELDAIFARVIATPDVALSALPMKVSIAARPTKKVPHSIAFARRPESRPMGRSGKSAGDEFIPSLLSVWERVFASEHIGIDDDFFELGGHSLLALKLFAEMDSEFGIALPLAAIFEAPSVRKLAQHLSVHEETTRHSSSLRLINPGGNLPPLFVVPGVGGNVVGFADLARAFGADRPVIGLEARGLDGGYTPMSQLETIAAHFVSEVRNYQPSGPCFLFGACIGGVIAFEMAHQMRCAGEGPALLVLLDPSFRGAGRISSAPKTLLFQIKQALGLPRFVLRRLRVYAQDARDGELHELPGRVWNKTRSLWQALRAGRLWVVARREISQVRVIDANMMALKNYQPRPYAGFVHIFLSDGRDGRHTPSYPWDEIASGGLKVENTPGRDSGDALSDPNVLKLAARLSTLMSANGLHTS
jgi:thioesterase domain-containing protein/acyl carrier protein